MIPLNNWGVKKLFCCIYVVLELLKRLLALKNAAGGFNHAKEHEKMRQSSTTDRRSRGHFLLGVARKYLRAWERMFFIISHHLFFVLVAFYTMNT